MIASMERLRQRRENLQGEGGFTLIELLIVVVILGILAAIVVFAVNSLTGTTAQASCQSDVATVDHAVQAYYGEKNAYPTSVNQLVTSNLLHSAPLNGTHYTIEMDKNVTATTANTVTTYTQATPPSGGVDNQIDVLSNNNGTAWTGKAIFAPTSGTSASSAAATACTGVN